MEDHYSWEHVVKDGFRAAIPFLKKWVPNLSVRIVFGLYGLQHGGYETASLMFWCGFFAAGYVIKIAERLAEKR